MNSASELREELNTPMDEIKAVTRTVKDILAGTNYEGGKSRVLTLVAPAGTSQNAERQRRAYQRRRETVLKREKEGVDAKFGRTAASLTDAAWEMKSELSAELNKPGYRSEGLRSAIKERTAAALQGKMFEKLRPGVKKGTNYQLDAGVTENEQATTAMEADNNVVVDVDSYADVEEDEYTVKSDAYGVEDFAIDYKEAFLEERARFAATLRLCLEAPAQTWLSKDVVQQVEVNEDVLGETITTMMLARDDFESDVDESFDMSFYQIVQEMERVELSIYQLSSLASSCAGEAAGMKLYEELRSGRQWSAESLIADRKSREEAAQRHMEELLRMERETKKTKVKPKREEKKNTVPGGRSAQVEKAEVTFLDAETINIQRDQFNAVDSVATTAYAEFEVVSDGLSDESFAAQVEVVNDDEEDQFIEVKYATTAGDNLESDEEEFDSEPPFFIKIILRSIDVVFYLTEKTITGIPRAINVSSTFLSRVDKAQQKESGAEGWKLLENLQSAENRY